MIKEGASIITYLVIILRVVTGSNLVISSLRIIPTLKARTLAEMFRDLIETKADAKYEALFLVVLAI